MLKFLFNGIKSSENGNKLEKAYIYYSSTNNKEYIQVGADGYNSFSNEIQVEFEVKNNTDSQVDYFDKDSFIICPDNRYFVPALESILKQKERQLKLWTNKQKKDIEKRGKSYITKDDIANINKQINEFKILINNHKNKTVSTVSTTTIKEALWSATYEPFIHTKTGEELEVLKLSVKLNKDEFKAFSKMMKDEEIGYYSNIAKGFILFYTPPKKPTNAPQEVQTTISTNIFVEAGRMTFTDPEATGKRRKEAHEEYIKDITKEIYTWVIDSEGAEKVQELISSYIDGYEKRYSSVLYSESKTASTFITGGSNFPVRRQNRLKEIANKKNKELIEWSEYRLKKIKNILQPTIIKSADDKAIEKLESKLKSLEDIQQEMKEVNKIIRKHKNTLSDTLIRVIEEGGYSLEALQPNYMGKIGYPGWKLSNNSATIRSTKKRLAKLKADRAKAQEIQEGRAEQKEYKFDGGKVLYNYEAQRVQVIFDDIPSQEVRTALKAISCRWSPKAKAWQLHLNEWNYKAIIKVIDEVLEKI